MKEFYQKLIRVLILVLLLLIYTNSFSQNTNFAYWVEASSACTISELGLVLNSTNGYKGMGYSRNWYGYLSGCGDLDFFDDCNNIRYNQDNGDAKGCWFPRLNVSGTIQGLPMDTINFGDNWDKLTVLNFGSQFSLNFNTNDLNGCPNTHSKIGSQVIWCAKLKSGNVTKNDNVFHVIGQSGNYNIDEAFINSIGINYGEPFTIVAYFINPMFLSGSISNYQMGDHIINSAGANYSYPGAGISYKELGPFTLDFSIKTNTPDTINSFCLDENMVLSTNVPYTSGFSWEYSKDIKFNSVISLSGSSNPISINTKNLDFKYLDNNFGPRGSYYRFFVRVKYSNVTSSNVEITLLGTEKPIIDKVLGCTSNALSSDIKKGYKIFPHPTRNKVDTVSITYYIGKNIFYANKDWSNIVFSNNIIEKFSISPFVGNNRGDRSVVERCSTLIPDGKVIIPMPTSVSINPTTIFGCTNPDSGQIALNASTMSSAWNGFTYSKTDLSPPIYGDVISGLKSSKTYNLLSYVKSYNDSGCYSVYPNYNIVSKDPTLAVSVSGSLCSANAALVASLGNNTLYSYFANRYNNDKILVRKDSAVVNSFVMKTNELYNFYVSDGFHCKSQQSGFFGKLPPRLTLNSFPQPCIGKKGSIKVTIQNGYGLLNVKLKKVYEKKELINKNIAGTTGLNSKTIETFNSLDSGYYKIVVSDEFGCSDSAFTNVGFNGPPKILNTIITNESCTGKINGIIDLNIDFNNKGPYNCLVSGNKDTIVYNNSYINKLSKGLYKVIITDSAGCSNTISSIEVDTTGRPIINKIVADSISCNSILDGKIKVSAISRGTSFLNTYELYKYNLKLSQTKNPTDSVFKSLDSGIYVVRVKDNFSCYSEKRGIVIGVYKPSINLSNLNSFSNCKGSLLASLSGNKFTTNNKTFALIKEINDTIQTDLKLSNNNIFNTDSGSYSVYVDDGNGCKLNSNYTTLLIKKPRIISAPIDYEKCLGNIKISAVGNSNIFRFYNRSSKLDSTFVFENSPYSFIQLGVNSYYIKVKDAYGCYSDSLKRDIQKDGISYFLGSYPFKDYNKCTKSIFAKAKFQNSVPGKLSYLLVINSKSDTTKIEAISDVLYKISPLSNDNYTVKLLDAKGCLSRDTIIRIDYINPVINITKGYSKCLGKLDLNISVYDKTKSNRIQCYLQNRLISPVDSTNLSAEYADLAKKETYDIKVFDGYYCEKDTSIFIDGLKDIPVFIKDTVTYSNCTGSIEIIPKFYNSISGTIILRNSSFIGIDTLKYAESNKTAILNKVLSGNYIAEIIDNLGCSNSKNINVFIKNPLVTDTISYSKCKYNIKLSSSNLNSGSIFYKLDDITTVKYPDRFYSTADLSYAFKETSAGVYRLSIEDGYGCKDSILRKFNPLPKPNFLSGFPLGKYENCSATINVKADFNTSNGDSIFVIDNSTNSIIDFKTGVGSNILYSFKNKENKYIKVIIKNNYDCSNESNTKFYNVFYDSTYFKSIPVLNKNTNCTGKLTINAHFGNTDPTKIFYGNISIYKLNSIADSTLVREVAIYGADTVCSFDQLLPGWYTVVLKDMAGCQSKKRVNNDISEPSINLSYYYSSCAGNLSAVGGHLNSYSTKFKITYYNISDSIEVNSNKYVFPGLIPGITYNVSIKDTLGCSTNSNIFIDTISRIPEFLAGYPEINYDFCSRKISVSGNFFNASPDSCHIVIYKNGNTNPYYTFYKVKSKNINILPNVENGHYTIMLEDAYGCTSQKINKIVNYNLPILNKLNTYENCQGVIKACAIVSDKLKTNRFRLVNSIGAIIYEKLSADTFARWITLPGKYIIYLRDGYNCEVNTKDTIENLEARPSFTNNCFYEQCKGSIKVKPFYNNNNRGLSKIVLSTQDNPNFRIIDSTKSGTYYYIKDLPNNTYRIEVIDGAGCSNDTTNTINVLQGPSLINPYANYNNCQREIIVRDSLNNIIGDSWLYLLKVKLPSDSIADSIKVHNTINTFHNLENGKYKFHIRDAAGCSLKTQIPTFVNYSIPTIDIDSGYENCHGKLIVKAKVSDSTKINTYTLDFISLPDIVKTSKSTVQSFINLDSGSYRIKFKDGYNCEISGSNYIPPLKPFPSFISAYPNRIYEYCHGTFKIKANYFNSISGTNKIHLFKTKDLDSTFQNANSGIEYSFINRDTGTYEVWLEDAAGCVNKSSDIKVQINEFKLKVAQLDPFENCLGAVTVNANTGNPVNKWYYLIGDTNLTSPPTVDSIYTFRNINGNPAKSFYVKVSDSYGCNDMLKQPIFVRIDENPLIQLIEQGYEKCKGTANIFAVFNNDKQNSLKSRKIVLFDSLNNKVFGYDSVFSAMNYKYADLNTGKYYVKVFDGYGCSIKSKSIDIKINQKPLFSIVPNPLYENCYGSLIVNPLYYNGSNNNRILLSSKNSFPEVDSTRYDNGQGYYFRNLSKGDYKIKLLDSYGCSDSINSIQIDSIVRPTFRSVVSSYSNCTAKIDGDIIFSNQKTPRFVYLLNSPASTSPLKNIVLYNDNRFSFDSLLNTSYWIKIRDGIGCEVTSSEKLIDLKPSPLIFSPYPKVNYIRGVPNIIVKAQINNYGNTKFTLYSSEINDFTKKTFDSITYNSLADSFVFTNSKRKYNWTKVTDTLGCMSLTLSVPLLDTLCSPKILSITNNEVKCYNDTTGSIIVNTDINSGSGLKTFILYKFSGIKYFLVKENTPIDNNNLCVFNGLSEGKYKIEVKDYRGNSDEIENININQPSIPLSTSIYTSPIKCYGDKTASIKITANGGRPQYEYKLDDDSFRTTNIYYNLGAGIYRINIKDNNGCSVKETVNISEPEKLVISSSSVKTDNFGHALQCSYTSDGKGEVSAEGGIKPYTISWFNNYRQIDADSLHSGVNTVIVTDANYCRDSSNVTISGSLIPPTLSLTLVPKFYPNGYNQSCRNKGDGEINSIVSGGMAPYNYYWHGPEDYFSEDSFLINCITGKYKIEVYDFKNCLVSGEQIISNPSLFFIDDLNKTNPKCFSSADGSISVNTRNGLAPFKFEINNNQTRSFSNKFVFSNLNAGIWQGSVKDSLGCSQYFRDTLLEPNAISLKFITKNLKCYDDSTGSIIIIINSTSADTLNYKYEWRKVGNSGIISTKKYLFNLKTGKYFLTIVDKNNCSQKFPDIEILQPEKLTVAAKNIGNTSCSGKNDGFISFSATGGTSKYYYSIDSGKNFQTSGYFNSLSNGRYQVIVKDLNDCIDSSFALIISGEIKTIIDSIGEVSCAARNDALISFHGKGSPENAYKYSIDGVKFNSINEYRVSAGVYHIITEDSLTGCKADEIVYNVPDKSAIKVNAILIDSSACKKPRGKIDALISGGSGKYNFKWFNAKNNKLLNSTQNLYSGSYRIVVSDTLSSTCVAADTINVPDREAPLITGFSILEYPWCNNPTGIIQVNISGGNPIFSYKWNDALNQLSQKAKNLIPGKYIVSISDKYNCTVTDSFILKNGKLVIIPQIIKANCGQSNGAVSFSIKGGLRPFRFKWNNKITIDSSFTGLSAGHYRLGVIDSLGCEDSLDFVIGNTDGPIISSISLIKSYCGLRNGSAKAEITGGNMPYKFEWICRENNLVVSNSQIAAGIGKGSYNLLVTDEKNCLVDSIFTIEDSLEVEPKVNIEIIDSSSCNKSNGILSANVNGGLPPYTYKWVNFSNQTNIIEDIQSGKYKVIITDSQGCVKSDSIILKDKALFNLQILGQTYSACGKPLGNVTLGISNYNSPYTCYINDETTGRIMLLDASTNSYKTSFDKLFAGNYSFIAQDASGCFSDTVFTDVIDASPMQINLLEKKNATCYRLSNGEARIEVINGAPQFLYKWNDSITTNSSFNLLSEGLNTVTVTDSNGCTISKDIEIHVPDKLFINNIVLVSPLCHGLSTGSIQIFASGGTGKYSYLWSTGDHSPYIENKSAGVYRFTIIDENNCSLDSIIPLPEPDSIQIDITPVLPSCVGYYDGSMRIHPSGGITPYSTNWRTLKDVVLPENINLKSGTYIAEVKDKNGCIASKYSTLNDPDPVSYNLKSLESPLCYGSSNGKIAIVPIGGSKPYKIWWNEIEGSDSLSNARAGKYFVKISDANGCQYRDSIILMQSAALKISTRILKEPKCVYLNDGEVVASTSGGEMPYSYTCNNIPEKDTIRNLPVGKYIIKVIDKNKCSNSATVFINAISNLKLNKLKIKDPTCYGLSNGEISICASEGIYPYKYILGKDTNANGQFTNLPSNSYILKAYDSVNCIIESNSIILSNPDSISLTINYNLPTCYNSSNGSIKVTAKNGKLPFAYYWPSLNSNLNIASGLSAGKYDIVIKDANNCESIQSLQLQNPDSLFIDSIKLIQPNCYGLSDGSINVFAKGGNLPYNYKLKNGLGLYLNSLDNLKQDKYLIEVNDAKYCHYEKEVELLSPPEIEIISTEVKVPTCYNDSNGIIKVTAIGGPEFNYNYLLTSQLPLDTIKITDSIPAGNFFEATNLKSGNYSILVKSKNCNSSRKFQLQNPKPIQIGKVFLNEPSCYGLSDGSIDINLPINNYLFNWNGMPGTSKYSNIPAGIYNCIITDSSGCHADYNFNLNQPDSLITRLNLTNPTCYGLNDGTIHVIASNGKLPYHYEWFDNLSFIRPDRSNLADGIYKIRVHYNNSCYKDIEATLRQPDLLRLSIANKNNPKCYGSSDGEINMNVVGGIPSYSLLWLNSNNEKFTSGLNLKAGLYKIIASDSNKCSEELYADLVDPEKLTTRIIKEDPTCHDSTNGKIELKPQGGTSPYIYLLNNTSSNFNSENLSKGKYHIQIKDANNCIFNDSTELLEPTSISFISEIIMPSCNGLSDGSLKIKASGGKLPYSYYLNKEKGGSVFYNLSSGFYTLEVEDKNNCKTSDSIAIGQPKTLTIEKLFIENPKCYNFSDGKFNVDVSGGSLPYSYKWYSDNLIFNSGDSLKAGDYSLQVSDKYNCNLSYSITLLNPQRLKMKVLTGDPLCFGNENGYINITSLGGTGNYDYYLNSIPAQAYNSSLKKGIYKVECVDKNNCTSSILTELKDPPLLKIDSIVTKIPECYGYSNGSLEIKASGGSGILRYMLDGYYGIGLFSSLQSKQYLIKVIDGNNCSVSENFELSQPEPLLFKNIILYNPSCYNYSNGSIRPEAEGGTQPFNYNIKLNKASLLSNNNLKAGKYTIYVSDINNCSIQKERILQNPAPIEMFFNKRPPQCFGLSNGSIESRVKGGNSNYSYYWNFIRGESVLRDIPKGDYGFKVVDDKGCSDSTLIYLDEPEQLLFSFLPNNPKCYGYKNGAIKLNASGGVGNYRYWNDTTEGSDLFENLSAGDYNFWVADSNNCVSSQNIKLNEPDSLYFSSIDFYDPTCFGKNNGIVNATVKGGTGIYKVKFNYNDTIITSHDSLIAGTFKIEVTDENSCFNSKTAVLTSPSRISADIIKNQPSCFGLEDGSISVNASGGTGRLFYELNGIKNSKEILGLRKGKYPLIITDENSCTFNTNVELNEPDQLQIKKVVLTSPKCYNIDDGSINFNITGGNDSFLYKLNFVTGNLPFNNLKGGNYTISVSDNHNCYTEKQVNLTKPDTLFLNVEKVFNSTCIGSADGAFSISIKGNYMPFTLSYYDENNNLITAPRDLRAGVYQAKVIDALGCKTVKDISISSPNSISLSNIEYNLPSCFNYKDGSIKVNPSGGAFPYFYLWNDGTPTSTIANISSGSYNVKVNDKWGCSLSKELSLDNPKLLTIESVQIINPLCYKGNSGSIEIFPSGGTFPYGFLWNNISKTKKIENLKAGKYNLKLTDAKNCYAEASYSLADPPKIQSTGIPESETVCPNVKYTLDPGQEWISCSWKSDKGFKSNQRKIEISEAGKYFLTATNTDNCVVLDTFSLKVDSSLMNAMFLMKSESKSEDTVVIIEVSQPVPDYVKWIFPDSTNRINSEYSKELVSFRKEGTNEVTLIAFLGNCSDTISKNILILPSSMRKDAPDKDTSYNNGIQSFDVSPNPCTEYFNILLKFKEISSVEISIVNISGVVLSLAKIRGLKKYNLRVDVSEFKKGAYFINVRDKKIIDQRTLIIK